MNIQFLAHSGFVLDGGDRAYVFDYYEDPKGLVEELHQKGRHLVFFVTHVHHDHYNPSILNWSSPHTIYIYHEEVPCNDDGVSRFYSMKVGESLSVDDMNITMHGSTDAGGSFYVNMDGFKVFHSGDLNWWHWLGDTPENIREAKELKDSQFASIVGMDTDVTMFPIDARLEEAREWGIIEYLRIASTKLVIPMHNNGPLWKPSVYFKALFPDQDVWIPQYDGDSWSW